MNDNDSALDLGYDMDAILSKVMNEPVHANYLPEQDLTDGFADMTGIDNIGPDNSENLKLALEAAALYDKGGRGDFDKDDPRSVASQYANAVDVDKLSVDEYIQYLDLSVKLDPTTESKTLAEEMSRKMASVEAAEFMTNEQLKTLAVNHYNGMTKEQFSAEMMSQPNLAEIISQSNIGRRMDIANNEVLKIAYEPERMKITFPNLDDFQKGDATMHLKKADASAVVKTGYKNELIPVVNDFVKSYQNTISPQITADKIEAGVDKLDPNVKLATLPDIKPPKSAFLSNLIKNARDKISEFGGAVKSAVANLNPKPYEINRYNTESSVLQVDAGASGRENTGGDYGD